MSKLKIGFLGAGYIAGVHASILARDERVQISAVHDLVEHRAEQLARSVGAADGYRMGTTVASFVAPDAA